MAVSAAMSHPIVLAAVAHPDDIEFMMAGTLALLKKAGAELHTWNLARGDCGTVRHSREEIIRLRWEEAQDAARVIGATAHAPLFDDIGIFYDQPSIARVAAVLREIKPTIVLTQSPQDYMEDHQNTTRLLVTAVFTRGMKNFRTEPQRAHYDGPVAVYHALPHGLCDPLRNPIVSHFYINVGSALKTKREMLAQHRSQKEWLDVSQGMDAYLNDMESLTRQVGKISGTYEYAEGWRRHLHFGFGPENYDPLKELLTGSVHETM